VLSQDRERITATHKYSVILFSLARDQIHQKDHKQMTNLRKNKLQMSSLGRAEVSI